MTALRRYAITAADVPALRPLAKTAGTTTAMGLPDRSDFGSPSELKVGDLVPWVVQLHDAIRAGKHYDIRLGKNRMLSFASRKGVPEPGDKVLATQQPIHAEPYMHFEGTLPTGYGAGEVRTADKGTALITKAMADRIQAVLAHRKRIKRLNLIRTDDKKWLLTNSTPTTPIDEQKVHYKSVSPDDLPELLTQDNWVQPKYDGAAAFYDIDPNKTEAYSYRTGTDGLPIVHTERLGLENTPAEGLKARLRGEILGVRDGKAIPAQELGGLLNSTLQNSLEEQRKRKIKLLNILFDVRRWKGKPVPAGTTYSEKLRMLREALKQLPADKFMLPDTVPGDQAQELVDKVFAGKDPLTHEGVVVHPEAGGVPTKAKDTDEYDVLINSVYPGGRNPGDSGGFSYSLTAGGPVVGNVGTGMTDETRQKLKDYVGRWAKIRSEGQFPSGAYRAPSLLAIHEDK